MKLDLTPIAEQKTLHGRVVLYDWDSLSESTSPKVWENVELLDETGNTIWRVSGMDKHPYWNPKLDTFVAINRQGEGLELISFSGAVYELDLNTGETSFLRAGK